MNTNELLTVRDVAKRLKTSRAFVRRIIQSGDLTALIVGREYRISVESLEAFIENNLY